MKAAAEQGQVKSDGSVKSLSKRTLNDLKGRDFSESADYLFNEREGAVLLQASLRGLNVLDCVLKLSFLEGRTVSVMPIEEFLRTHVTSGDENDAHARHVVERNRERSSLTIMCAAPDGSSDGGFHCLLKTIPVPHGWTSSFWPDQQRQVKMSFEPVVRWYQSADPEEKREFLGKLVADGLQAALDRGGSCTAAQ